VLKGVLVSVMPVVRWSGLQNDFVGVGDEFPAPSVWWNWTKTDYGIRIAFARDIDLTVERTQHKHCASVAADRASDQSCIARRPWRRCGYGCRARGGAPAAPGCRARCRAPLRRALCSSHGRRIEMRNEMIGAVVRRAIEHPEFRRRLFSDGQLIGMASDRADTAQIPKPRRLSPANRGHVHAWTPTALRL